jgi:hypothetical protein
LLPARRPRYSARKIKAPTSRYQARCDPRPRTATAITAIGITIDTPALDPRPRRTRYTPKKPRPPRPPTRRQRVTALMSTHPNRARSGQELAAHLQIKPHNLLTQLAEWARWGFLTNIDYGTYTLNSPPPTTPSTTAPDS